jgi:iron(III) transport system permease protein
MLTAIVAINLFVGERRLRRTNAISHSNQSSATSSPSLKEKHA